MFAYFIPYVSCNIKLLINIYVYEWTDYEKLEYTSKWPVKLEKRERIING